MPDLEYNFISKVVVIGEPGAGKTSLISKYTLGTFNKDYIRTMGAQFSKYDKLMGERQQILFRLLFWDIAGQDQYSFMRPTFYNGAEGAIIVYDLTKPETLDAVITWFEDVRKNCGEIPTVLFGNKLDLINNADSYDKSKVDDIMKKHRISNFYTTSAKTGLHVKDAFDCIIDILVKPKLIMESQRKNHSF